MSFGAENDAVIAPYMSGLGKKNIKAKKTSGKSSTGTAHPKREKSPVKQTTSSSAAADDYEIGGFIDRSKPKQTPQKVEASTTGAKDAATPKPKSKAKKPKELAPWQHKMNQRLHQATVNGAAVRQQLGVPKEESVLVGDNKAGRARAFEDRRVKEASRTQSLPRDRAPDASQPRPKLDKWAEHKNSLKEKFPEGWAPRKKLSPDAMEGIRGLHEQDPNKYSTPVLAEQFKVSPEAIRRILKSRWLPKAGPEKMEERRERWAKRHDRIWDQQAELGLRPQRKKETNVEDPEKFEKEMVRKEILGNV